MQDQSDIITITGTKEGIEKAEHEIRVISDEQVIFLNNKLLQADMYILSLIVLSTFIYNFTTIFCHKCCSLGKLLRG